MKKSDIKPGAHLAYGTNRSDVLGGMLMEVVVAEDQIHQGMPLNGRTRVTYTYSSGRAKQVGSRIVFNSSLLGTWEQHLAAKKEREEEAIAARRALDERAAQVNEAVRSLCEAFGTPVLAHDDYSSTANDEIALPYWAQSLTEVHSDYSGLWGGDGEMTVTDLKEFFDAVYQMGYSAAQMNFSTEG